MPQPAHDLETASKVAGVVAGLIALLAFGRRLLRWLVRLVVADAFPLELSRGEHSAAAIIGMSERLDAIEENVASNAELLGQIPLLVQGQERIERAQEETRQDVKAILQQLGQVQGRSAFGPLTPESDR